MIFKPIPDLKAEASSCGQIKSSFGRIMKQLHNSDGYLRTKVDGKTRLVHRMVASAWIDNPNNLPEVNHKDGVKSNNNVYNLEWCNHKYNMVHAKNEGLIAFGVRNGNSLLDEVQVRTIHACFSDGILVKDLVKYFKVKKEAVYSILRGENWKRLSLPRTKFTNKGEEWCRSKLKNIDIGIIKDAINAGHKPTDISNYYNISSSVIYNIKNGKRWGSVS